jgi:hypothetical protein
MNSRVQHVLSGVAGLVLAGAPAAASVVSFSGSTELIAPPAFVTMVTNYGSTPGNAVVWNELQGVTISNLQMTLTANPGMSGGPFGGPVSGVVDSHYLYWWRDGAGARTTGSVTFSGRILGVAYDVVDLVDSDAPLGPPGTVYDPTMILWRGLSPGDPITINGNTLEFLFKGDGAFLDMAQLRVITAAPAPGAMALLVLGGLSAAPRRRR